MKPAAPATTAGVTRRSQAERSASADVRNPLLALASAQAVALLSDAERQELRTLLDEIRREARCMADRLWARRRVRAAAYWRACSVYAGHAARLAHHRRPPQRERQAAHDCVTGPALHIEPNSVLALPAVRALRALRAETRATLRALLLDLRRSAAESSKSSWAKSKSPMAAYWADVATVAGAAARTLRDAPSMTPLSFALTVAGDHRRMAAHRPVIEAAINDPEFRAPLACA